jgi:protein-tyrosine phosphatase
MAHNFGPAYQGETIVFGASRPGYNGKKVSLTEVQEWIQFMQGKGIQRIVCLLPENQLVYYQDNLRESYRQEFGTDNVLHAPIEDFHLSSPENLTRVLIFLRESETLSRKTVVHCSGGIGRTGHVLAGWLVHARGLGPEDAIYQGHSTSQPAAQSSRSCRNPWRHKVECDRPYEGLCSNPRSVLR